ncbi:unnamed protein product [Phaedon cochleariae]|uniref:Uncharacterized protein n=1 Tax=Phaedon cochleariae TaxID=80249 RepID=A0A9N9SEE3_PHACE|nr:unnamed protein product [Phaedon cochleariae]
MNHTEPSTADATKTHNTHHEMKNLEYLLFREFDLATYPRPIRRQKEITSITPNNPNDPRSPFYNEDGEPINPIAKLHFTRQRVYEKPCEILENEDEDHTDNNLELSGEQSWRLMVGRIM